MEPEILLVAAECYSPSLTMVLSCLMDIQPPMLLFGTNSKYCGLNYHLLKYYATSTVSADKG
jgi:hypothetical protein